MKHIRDDFENLATKYNCYWMYSNRDNKDYFTFRRRLKIIALLRKEDKIHFKLLNSAWLGEGERELDSQVFDSVKDAKKYIEKILKEIR